MINHGANSKIIVSTPQFIVVKTKLEVFFNRFSGLFSEYYFVNDIIHLINLIIILMLRIYNISKIIGLHPYLWYLTFVLLIE